MIKPDITYDDFSKLDLRVGKVTEASLPEWSEKLIRYEADFGEELGKRILFSGIRAYVKPEEMIGKKYIFVVNMAYKKMGPEESQGMMIMADSENGAVLIPVPDEVEVGATVR